eukprot:365630-Chlamydomonas_euryale.AAC.33
MVAWQSHGPPGDRTGGMAIAWVAWQSHGRMAATWVAWQSHLLHGNRMGRMAIVWGERRLQAVARRTHYWVEAASQHCSHRNQLQYCGKEDKNGSAVDVLEAPWACMRRQGRTWHLCTPVSTCCVVRQLQERAALGGRDASLAHPRPRRHTRGLASTPKSSPGACLCPYPKHPVAAATSRACLNPWGRLGLPASLPRRSYCAYLTSWGSQSSAASLLRRSCCAYCSKTCPPPSRAAAAVLTSFPEAAKTCPPPAPQLLCLSQSLRQPRLARLPPAPRLLCLLYSFGAGQACPPPSCGAAAMLTLLPGAAKVCLPPEAAYLAPGCATLARCASPGGSPRPGPACA